MPSLTTFQDLLTSVIDRGTRLVEWRSGNDEQSLMDLCLVLNSTRGEASGVALARRILSRYKLLDSIQKRDFFLDLAAHFDPDSAQIVQCAEHFAKEKSPEALKALTTAVESPRQELFRRLNQAPGATAELVSMRADLLSMLREDPTLRRIDDDFRHLLGSWFNRGFLVMQRIDWSTSAQVLEKIIDYEAVHEIPDWDELRRRLRPSDRRCFAFFHPSMPEEPLVFVEVALTLQIADSIAGVLREDRQELAPEDADTAVFYSISNCQPGLRGVSFGHFLIKQVARDLSRELPNIKTFVTLSPAPGFGKWLAAQADSGNSASAKRIEEILSNENWKQDDALSKEHAVLVSTLAAEYYLHAKRDDGQPVDPVARFHLGNGAILNRINPQANLSAQGLKVSAGMMVNYLYDLKMIEENHEAYATQQNVRVSRAVLSLAGSGKNTPSTVSELK